MKACNSHAWNPLSNEGRRPRCTQHRSPSKVCCAEEAGAIDHTLHVLSARNVRTQRLFCVPSFGDLLPVGGLGSN